MADLIRHKRSSVPSAVPAAGDLALGELAVNVADGRLFLKKANGDMVDVTSIAGIIGLTEALAGKAGSDDPRLSDAREWSAETVAQAEAEAGTATTRRAWTSQRVRQAIVAWWNGVSSAWGRGFVSSADAAAGRTALELGNAATRTALGTTGALYSRDSILGTVSQSGGVPTGAIIEYISNANGEAWRFVGGLQICTRYYSVTVAATALGTLYRDAVPGNGTWTFPAGFVTAPRVDFVPVHGSCWATHFGPSALSANPIIYALLALNVSVPIDAIAIGRWY